MIELITVGGYKANVSSSVSLAVVERQLPHNTDILGSMLVMNRGKGTRGGKQIEVVGDVVWGVSENIPWGGGWPGG